MGAHKAITKVYEERRDFIIIGLTGRTGSGCTTVADILREDFKNLKLKNPKEYDYKNSKERKYSIIYKYANNISKEEKWYPFEIISVSDIIASFVIEKGYKETKKYIKKTINNKNIYLEVSKVLKKSIEDIINVSRKIRSIRCEYTRNLMIANIIYQVYLNDIPRIMKELKKNLSDFSIGNDCKKSQLYTLLLQEFGNNIRSSGDPFKSSFNSNCFLRFTERINSIIKAIKYLNKNVHNRPTFICIDAIRNPFEAAFFRERYRAFYLIAVSTDDSSRIRRLSHLTKDEIVSLDEIEYPEKIENEKKFYHQNVAACLEIADIYIYNPEVENENYFFLTEQIIKYLILIWHPGLITPTAVERCMQIAVNAKLNSGCLSRQVGAVVTDGDYSVKSVGWNDVPKGQIPCNLRDCKQYLKNKDEETYSDYEITNSDFTDAMNAVLKKVDYSRLQGRTYPYCFKDVYNGIKGKDNQVYTRALHAEENAFLQIAKYGGEGVKNGFLFTTASPCELCAKKAYQLGIKKIYYIDPYPGISQKHILTFGKQDNPKMILFHGAIGNAYVSLYMPKMPFKDELEMLTGIKTKNPVEEWRIETKGK